MKRKVAILTIVCVTIIISVLSCELRIKPVTQKRIIHNGGLQPAPRRGTPIEKKKPTDNESYSPRR